MIEGAGVALAILMGRSIINDRFANTKAARIFSFIFTANALAVILLTILGAYVGVYLHWRWIFIAMGIYGACVTLLIYWLMPSRPSRFSFSSLSLKETLKNYRAIFTNRSFWTFLLCLAFMMAGEKAFTTSATFIYVLGEGMSIIAFGYLKAGIWASHLLGLLVCSALVGRQGIDRMMSVGIFLIFVAALVLLFAILFGFNSGVLLAAMMLVYMFGSGFIMATAVVGIVRPFPKLIGLATATAMFIEFMLAFGVSLLVSELSTQSIMPISMVIICMGLAGGLVRVVLGCRGGS